MTDVIIFVDGRRVATDEPAISPLDRGFTLGDGVFETMLAVGRRVFRLDAHLRRLVAAADAIRLPALDIAALRSTVLDALGDDDVARIVRLTVSRGVDPGRGILLSASRPTVVVRALPATPPDPALFAHGIAVMISPIRRNETSVTARHKTLNYLDNILARDDARRQGYDDAILLNTAGEIACATTANVFLVAGGALRTPALAGGALAGITRAAIVEIATAAGRPVEEACLTVDDLDSADEVFLTNSALGVVPVVGVGGSTVGDGRPGPITARLAAAYRELVRAELHAPTLAVSPIPLEPDRATHR